MRAYDFVTYDVFTDRRFAGNQLAVVLDAEGLSGDEMQAITREFNLSETTFVLPPEDRSHAARVRIFTPGRELPFAGHPTVGTAIALAKARGLKSPLTLELTAGLFPVDVRLGDGGGAAAFVNPNLPKESGAAPSADALEAALGLPRGSVFKDGSKPRTVNAGVDFVYAMAPLNVVRSATLNHGAWDALGINDTAGVYLYAEGGEAADASFHARMFAPNSGIDEDPATGSAAAGFPGQIALSGALGDGEHRWIIEQGFEMGRPSRIELTVGAAGGAVRSVRIGGEAVFVQQGQLFA